MRKGHSDDTDLRSQAVRADTGPGIGALRQRESPPSSRASVREPTNSLSPLANIVAIPKPFTGLTRIHQLNALKSWSRLAPEIVVTLAGNEPGVADAAAEFGCRHLAEIDSNEFGTPLVSHALELAQAESRAPLVAYVNSDIVLLEDFYQVVKRLAEYPWPQFLAIGRRVEMECDRLIDFDDSQQLQILRLMAEDSARLAPLVCKDYFIFPAGALGQMPPLLVGRGNWDNWMVHSAKKRKLPVIDTTQCLKVLHPQHDHHHVPGGRLATYVTGVEARRNQRAAGGRHLAGGSTATWRMTSTGYCRQRGSSLNLAFWRDLPRFARLLAALATSGRRDRSAAPDDGNASAMQPGRS